MRTMNRRQLLAAAALLPLAGCAGGLGVFSPEEGVRRLLTLSSERAFARLIRPGGFYDDQLTRIAPPDAGGDAGVLGAVLRTNAVRRRVALALNEVAVEAADRAAPVVFETVRGMSFGDVVAVARGGPTAATDLLAARIEGRLVEAMFPEFQAGLSGDLFEVAAAALGARTGLDPRVLARDGARLASRSIFRAIGREEAAIRADPRSTRDPVIIALLS